MTIKALSHAILLGAALVLLPEIGFGATKPMQLTWADLIPAADQAKQQAMTGIIQHEEIGTLQARTGVGANDTVEDLVNGNLANLADVRSDLDGKVVRIPGYVIPMAFNGSKVNEFILVPYVGACIHVPPPPANQLIFVASDKGVAIDGLFAAVWVTGTISATSLTTDVAEVGYQIKAIEVTAIK